MQLRNLNAVEPTIIGSSPAFLEAMALARRVARTNTAVLVGGETGTGKELIATVVHQNSLRSRYRFVKVNCAAMPEALLESEMFGYERGAFTGADQFRVGRFEQANAGTIFLDEIGDMSAGTQAKILRVLQEGEFERLGSSTTVKVDVRLITATHRNLTNMVAQGLFREDLYYRLNVVSIEVPPLRRRKKDIPDLAEYFVRHYSAEMGKGIKGIEPDALKLLVQHPWPGNVRELKNVLERAVLMADGDTLRVGDVFVDANNASVEDDSMLRIPKTGVSLKEIERQALVEALKMTDWVQADAARLLRVLPRVMNYKIRKHGISPPEGVRLIKKWRVNQHQK